MTLGRLAIIRPVILCGGAGTRLWPVSRQTFPKQLLP
ncbi:MAG: sugar phosphate nucleotidyltransferase, partial [Sphingomicrobium sp.]